MKEPKKKYFDLLKEIENAVRIGPKQSHLEEIKELINANKLQAQFFNSLKSSDWISPLLNQGYFLSPPSPSQTENYIQYLFWPESQYLLRVVEHAPQEVLKIALALPATENERVHEDFTQAACKMPPELAVQWAEKEIEWLKDQKYLHLNLPLYLGDLVSYLAEGGEQNHALNLAKGLLALQPDPQYEQKLKEEQQEEEGGEEFILRYYPEPETKFDSWEYEQILKKNIPALVKAAGIDTFKWLCQLLSAAMRLARRHDDGDEKPLRDYSYIWRPAIEEHEQNQKYDLKDYIVDAVRDAAEQLIVHDPKNLASILTILDDSTSLPWPIFRRITLHIVRNSEQAKPSMVRRYLAKKRYITDHVLHHEHRLLVSEKFGMLSLSEQDKVLKWVLEGKKGREERIYQWYQENEDREPTETELDSGLNSWLSEKLAPFEKFLRDELKDSYDAAIASEGRADHPEFVTYSTGGWVGPTSPKSPAELGSLSVSDLLKFLREWKPTGESMSDSRDGLARVLAAILGENPKRYIDACAQLTDEDHPTYIRGFIQGFHDAARDNRNFIWEPVLELCKSVVDRPRNFSRSILAKAVGDDREEIDWGWTRKRIANLIEEGLKKDREVTIPFDLREEVWLIIKILTGDPEPTYKDEKERMQPFDAATMSINTVRGEAMHAVMYYVMWVRENIRKKKGDQELVRGFALIPEVQQVLEERLDRRCEKTLTIRSVFGRWYPYLVAWDENWAKTNKQKVFPSSEKAQKHWDVAWGTCVVYNRPYDNVFRVLRNEYRKALERIGFISVELAGARPPDESLAQHILTFYWRGMIRILDKSLLNRFYELASPELRGQAMRFIGKTLADTPGTVPEKIIERLKKLWTWRLKTAQSSDQPDKFEDELSAFGKWFGSGKLDPSWTIEQLLVVLSLIGRVDADKKMVEQLAALADSFPKEVTECFRMMVEGVSDGYKMWSWKEPGKELLRTVINGEDRGATKAAIDLVHRLGAMGHMEFRDLLPTND